MVFGPENYHSVWLPQIETQRANKFYRKFRLKGKVKSNDICAVVKDERKDIIASGILRPYRDFSLLTGIAVAPNYQRRGVGKILLKLLATNFDSNTFAFPYIHLVDYYQYFGFEVVEPLQINNEVRNLFVKYVNQGRDIEIMNYRG